MRVNLHYMLAADHYRILIYTAYELADDKKLPEKAEKMMESKASRRKKNVDNWQRPYRRPANPGHVPETHSRQGIAIPTTAPQFKCQMATPRMHPCKGRSGPVLLAVKWNISGVTAADAVLTVTYRGSTLSRLYHGLRSRQITIQLYHIIRKSSFYIKLLYDIL